MMPAQHIRFIEPARPRAWAHAVGIVFLLTAPAVAWAQPGSDPNEAPPLEPGQTEAPPGHPPLEPGQTEAPPGHPPLEPGHPPSEAPPLEPGQTEVPPGHPPTAGIPGHGRGPSEAQVAQALQPPRTGAARPSTALPPGSIRVRVVDSSGRPLANAEVALGVRRQEGERERVPMLTDANGIALYEDLATGSAQAYRVNVPFEGATYSSTPFQLPTDRGYEVELTRLPVTQSPSSVFFHLFRVIVEQGNERMRVIHQVRLTNAGTETYVFPQGGTRMELPEAALNFNAEAVMTDQHVEEIADQHAYRIRGSLPPGTVQLAYAYDLEVGGTTLDIPVVMPFSAFGVQVFSETLPGLTFDIPGMPEPQRLDMSGHPCVDSAQTGGCVWMTQMQQSNATTLILHLRGIPGPGNERWWATGFAVVLLLVGAFFFVTGGTANESHSRARASRRQALIDEARMLDEELESGEVGPDYREKRRQEIVRELAALLHEDAAENAPAT